MEHDVLDAFIEAYAEFGSTPVRAGEQVFLYRRLQDAYDAALVCVVNEMSEPVGYLDRALAIDVVLPRLKEGVRFQCIIHGEANGGRVPIQLTMMEQSEVTAILEKRGGLRRGQASTMPPLAGVFDDEATTVDDEDELDEVPLPDDEVDVDPDAEEHDVAEDLDVPDVAVMDDPDAEPVVDEGEDVADKDHEEDDD